MNWGRTQCSPYATRGECPGSAVVSTSRFPATGPGSISDQGAKTLQAVRRDQ